MSYRVIKYFADAKDKGYIYNVGDTYPRKGLSVGERRIAELLSKDNAQRDHLIESLDETGTEEVGKKGRLKKE